MISSITYSQEHGNTIVIANAFTPTLDNNNTFGPTIISDDYTLFIYNRWGNLVFQGKTWDGTSNGKICENDTYVWNVKLFNGENYYGTVLLIK